MGVINRFEYTSAKKQQCYNQLESSDESNMATENLTVKICPQAGPRATERHQSEVSVRA